MAFSTLRHCRRGQGFGMLEITLPFLQQFMKFCISIVPIRKKRRGKNPWGKVVVGIQVVVIFSFLMKSKPRK